MSSKEIKRFVEMILFILNRTGGIDAYHLFKILYFAELNLLGKRGASLVPDVFLAMENGPVPERLYKALKASSSDTDELSEALHSVLKKGIEDAQNILMARISVYHETLTEDEKWALSESAEKNSSLSFIELREKSHDEAWKSTGRNEEISRISMAKAATSDKGMIAYIIETVKADKQHKAKITPRKRRRTKEESVAARELLKTTSGRGIEQMKKWL